MYSSLDPRSLSENLAFYELYPESQEGKRALKRAWGLLNQDSQEEIPLDLKKINIQPFISLINHQEANNEKLDTKTLDFIERLAKPLKNRDLKGHKIKKIEEVFSLKPEEVDLARSLFLAQLNNEPDAEHTTRHYEATIDLMALQIAAKLKPHSSPIEKVRAINHFIFHEMQFRFPPQSLWAKDIDTYTFLSSVIDSRKGVCLGVSILYLCLAQRLDLSLEAVTPPGHIFVRYVDDKGEITNIETTARGIDVPSEHYLGLEMEKLPTKNILEVIGLAFVNEASVQWSQKKYQEAAVLYEKAKPFLSNDPLLMELLGYTYLFIGEKQKGETLLKKVLATKEKSNESVIEDYFAKNTDIEGIQAIFLPVDETRESIIQKRKELEEILQNHPKFRAGLLQLSNTWLQLGREKEALKILETYYKIDPTNPRVNYYLSAICLMRSDYNRAWLFLKEAKKYLLHMEHSSKVLAELQKHLERVCPESE